MLDLVIKGGTVIDGSGAPARAADVGIRDGRIVAVGEIDEEAREVIDATGQVVSPGFVDIHTHYDAQVFWDPTLSPSCYHGVTTVIAGNCGFTIAPLNGNAEDSEYLMRMLARVEGMPLESLREGVPWNWQSFGDYLGQLDGRLAINAGFMVGHSAIRRHVMGKRAVGETASEAEVGAMQALLRESLAAGGLGFSSTLSVTHNDADGKPVPSRHASDEELFALASVVSEFPGTTLEMLPGLGSFSEEEKERMTRFSLAGQRPVNWNVMNPNSAQREMYHAQLAASDYAAARGARIVALTVPQPMTVRLNFVSGFLLDALPGWAEVVSLPMEERKRALADPAVRKRLDDGANSEAAGLLRALARWDTWTVDEAFSEANKVWKGRTLGELASAQHKTAFDAMLDLALEEDLKTSFSPPAFGSDEESWRMRGESWRDPRTVIGASDAGAHLDMIDTFAFSTKVLEQGVRKRQLLSLEEAVHQLTAVPAELIGLKDRGRLREGYCADVVVFDPERIASGPVHTRFDLPAGAGRLYADAIGVSHVVVNGREIVRDGAFTGDYAGTVLRSGRDTYTVGLGETRH
jgi:N-acyl-D-aspartate/D-glutamate deacylase